MAAPTIARLDVAARTDIGSVRTRNDDFVFAEPIDSDAASAHGWLGIVADGMGGRPSGDLASRLAVETTRKVYYSRSRAGPPQRLRSAVEHANDVIYRASISSEALAQMGTTITAAVVRDAQLCVAQVGDSRGYLIRGGRVKRITRDHSLVEELLRLGELTPEEAANHPHRNVITRALGAQPRVQVDIFQERLMDDDSVLLCSDGLHRVVDDSELARSLSAEPLYAAENLIGLANQRGGPDNISVVIARVHLLSN